MHQHAGDSQAAAHARTVIASVEYMADVEGGRAEFERAIEVAQDEGLEELAALAYCILANGSVIAHLHARTESHIDVGIEYCVEHDLDGFRPFLLAMRAQLRLQPGRWADAAESASLVVAGVHRERGGSRGLGPGTVYGLAVLGRVRARRGDPEAWVPLDKARYSREHVGSDYIGWLHFQPIYEQLVATQPDMFE